MTLPHYPLNVSWKASAMSAQGHIFSTTLIAQMISASVTSLLTINEEMELSGCNDVLKLWWSTISDEGRPGTKDDTETAGEESGSWLSVLS